MIWRTDGQDWSIFASWSKSDANLDAVQVQRGLGFSKLGVSSVGGTYNIYTNLLPVQGDGNVFQEPIDPFKTRFPSLRLQV